MVGLGRGVSGIAGVDRRVVSTSTSAYWARAAPVPWPRPAGKFFGIRRVPPCGAQRTAPGAGCCNTRAVVAAASLPVRGGSRGPGRRIAADLGRAHGTHRPCPLTCVETWRSRGSGRGTLRTIRSAMRPPGAAGRWESSPWEVGPWEAGEARTRSVVHASRSYYRCLGRHRGGGIARGGVEPGSPIGSSCPLQIKGLSCGWAGGTMPPRVCTAVGRLRTVDPAPSRGQRAPGGNRGADRSRWAEDRLPARGRRAPARAAARRVE